MGLSLGTKEVSPHLSSKSPCAVGIWRLCPGLKPHVSTSLASNPNLLMECSLAGTAFHSCLSFHPRRVSSKSLPSLTGKESQLIIIVLKSLFKPKRTHRTLWKPCCWGRKGTRRASILLTAALSGAGAQRVTFVPGSKL